MRSHLSELQECCSWCVCVVRLIADCTPASSCRITLNVLDSIEGLVVVQSNDQNGCVISVLPMRHLEKPFMCSWACCSLLNCGHSYAQWLGDPQLKQCDSPLLLVLDSPPPIRPVIVLTLSPVAPPHVLPLLSLPRPCPPCPAPRPPLPPHWRNATPVSLGLGLYGRLFVVV